MEHRIKPSAYGEVIFSAFWLILVITMVVELSL